MAETQRPQLPKTKPLVRKTSEPQLPKTKPPSRALKDKYIVDIADYIIESNNFFTQTVRKEEELAKNDPEELVFKKELTEMLFKEKKRLSEIFKTLEDFKKRVPKQRLSTLINLNSVKNFISKVINDERVQKGAPVRPLKPKTKPQVRKTVTAAANESSADVPKAPMVPDKLAGVTQDDRKYATAIASIIINCNSDLKQFGKAKENKEQIVYAVLQCKDFKKLRKTYKNSLEFLEKARIKFFHTDKTPEDVKKSLDKVLDAGPKEPLTAQQKKYVEEAMKFVQHYSEFPSVVKTRALKEMSKFIKYNIKIFEKHFNPFKEIATASIYDELKGNKITTFKKFQEKFIKYFKLAYSGQVLKPID